MSAEIPGFKLIAVEVACPRVDQRDKLSLLAQLHHIFYSEVSYPQYS